MTTVSPTSLGNPPATRRLDAAALWLTGLTPEVAVILSALLVAGVGFADWVLPNDYNFGPLYFLTVCIAAWSLGPRGGYVVGLVCAIVSTVLQLDHLHGVGPILWNTVSRAGVNILVAALVGSLRRTHDREHALARTDGLTGALNKRAFQEAITHMLERARREHDMIVVSYLDLDGFKTVNDTFGHAAGDAVLNSFAQAAKAEAGENGVLARVGGDEFVLVQRYHIGDDHFAAAEGRHARLTEALAALPYEVTCSMGVVIAKGGTTDQVRLIAFADALLYEVKRAGKNSLRIAETQDVPEIERRAA